MKTFTLSFKPGARNEIKNRYYPVWATISSIEMLKNVVQYDNVAGSYKDDIRRKEKFIKTDCVFMDIDNDFSENSADWITPEKLAERLPDVAFYAVCSKSHMKQKDEYSPRPRHHYYFALSEVIEKVSRIDEIKEMLFVVVPEFDPKAKDAARFFAGVENPQCELIDGSLCIDEFLVINNIQLPEKTITNKSEGNTEGNEKEGFILSGARNDTIFRTALNALQQYSDEKARQIFDAACARCKPPLSVEECARTWQSAVKTRDEIKQRYAVKKKALTLKVVAETLKGLNIQLRFNVINRKNECSDLPQNESILSEYYDMSASDKEKANDKLLPLFLTAFFKDKHFSFSENFLNGCLQAVADANPRNPVLEMIQATTYDGKKRIDELCRVLGIQDNEMYCTFLKKWLHQTVALALNDDGSISLEFVLVLQGKQGTGKTNFFKHLAGDHELFLEGAVIDTRNKDSLMQGVDTWITEIGEFDATASKEQSSLKAFLTQSHDVFRRPYAKKAEKIERRTSFCATVNPENVLRDETGNRRYVFIHVDNIDKKFIFEKMTPEYVAQLWREVYDTLYITNGRTGFYLTDAEREFSEKANQSYSVVIEGETEIRDILDFSTNPEYWQWYTVTELKEKYSILEKEKVKSPKLGRAIVKVLKSYGYDIDEYRRCVHGCMQYKLPRKRGDYTQEILENK